jgi:hypothetical protein
MYYSLQELDKILGYLILSILDGKNRTEASMIEILKWIISMGHVY